MEKYWEKVTNTSENIERDGLLMKSRRKELVEQYKQMKHDIEFLDPL